MLKYESLEERLRQAFKAIEVGFSEPKITMKKIKAVDPALYNRLQDVEIEKQPDNNED